MDQAEVSLHFALRTIESMQQELATVEVWIKDGLKALEERKPKRKRSKKDGS